MPLLANLAINNKPDQRSGYIDILYFLSYIQIQKKTKYGNLMIIEKRYDTIWQMKIKLLR